ncbi:hypothetical protein H4R19_004564 [Coemansia spiralis]|nr:hypothetical protein H4R19_004564 [Coemansia spiralis]
MRKLVIGSTDAIPLELITYTGLTHLQLNGPTNADDVVQLIHRQRHLVNLHIDRLNLGNTRTEFSIPECAEHEPVPPLDTQIKKISILRVGLDVSQEAGTQILKYLLLRIPTLKYVDAMLTPKKQIQAFIDEYIQWYPHLANGRT